MKLLRQLVITAEKTETFTIRQETSKSLQGVCPKCEQVIQYLTVDQTVNLTRLGARTIFRLVEAGEIHCSETVEGHLLLCPNSVARLVQA